MLASCKQTKSCSHADPLCGRLGVSVHCVQAITHAHLSITVLFSPEGDTKTISDKSFDGCMRSCRQNTWSLEPARAPRFSASKTSQNTTLNPPKYHVGSVALCQLRLQSTIRRYAIETAQIWRIPSPITPPELRHLALSKKHWVEST